MNSTPKLLGLHIDPVGVGMTSVEDVAATALQAFTCEQSPKCLVCLSSEATIADAGMTCPDIRLVGMPGWSLPGKEVDLKQVWKDLLAGDHNESSLTNPEHQLAAIAADAIGYTSDSHGSVTVVIPNSLDELAQDRLLRAFEGRLSGRVRLIWLPIAAALSWAQAAQQHIRPIRISKRESFGSILSIHFGGSHFEAAIMQCITQTVGDREILLPARDRPSDIDRKCLRTDLGEMLVKVLHETMTSSRPGNKRSPGYPQWLLPLSRSWARVVMPPSQGSSILRALTNGGSHDLEMPTQAQVVSTIQTLTQARPAGSLTRLFQSDVNPFMEWIESVRSLILRSKQDPHSTPLIGVVVSGVFRHLPYSGEVCLAQRVLDMLDVSKAPGVLITGLDQDSDPLADGAAIFQARSAMGLPTYLDTLPTLELLVTHEGEPAWYNLLSKDGKPPPKREYVPGDEEWTRPPVEGLAVRAYTSELPIKLAMEGMTVRDSVTELPLETNRKESVELNVRIRPASGSAHVEVVSNSPTLKFNRRVKVDFLRMKDLRKTKQEIIDECPRVCPLHAPRSASKDRWLDASSEIAETILALKGKPGVDRLVGLLEKLRDQLRSKDNSDPKRRGASAVSSEGECGLRTSEAQGVLRELVEHLVKLLDHRNEEVKNLAVWCLGYASADDSRLSDLLMKYVQSDSELSQWSLIAIGNCMRNPVHIAKAIGKIRRELTMALAPMDRLKAIAQLCRYRENALSRLPLKEGEELAYELYREIEKQYSEVKKKPVSRRTLAYNFRESCVGVLFLLRLRKYQDTFLEPDGETASRLKLMLQRISKDVENKEVQVILGAVDPAKVLQAIIEYIDKHGSRDLEKAFDY